MSRRLKAVFLVIWVMTGGFALGIALSSMQTSQLLAELLTPLAAHVAGEKALYSPLAYFVLLDPLRFIQVTPHSHRGRHALGEVYQDKNFGFFFCIWDRIVGTHYEVRGEYPVTGIMDRHYPMEKSSRPVALTGSMLRQLIYPFRQVFHSL